MLILLNYLRLCILWAKTLRFGGKQTETNTCLQRFGGLSVKRMAGGGA
jgi:hypothetical protein